VSRRKPCVERKKPVSFRVCSKFITQKSSLLLRYIDFSFNLTPFKYTAKVKHTSFDWGAQISKKSISLVKIRGEGKPVSRASSEDKSSNDAVDKVIKLR